MSRVASSPAELQGLTSVSDSRRWYVLLFVGMGAFMSTLDSTVVNSALPQMATSLHSTLGEIDWVVTIYLLTGSGLLLTAGRLADVRGHKPVSLVGFSIFTLASGLCVVAPNLEALVAFRLLQGIGAAMIYASGPAIIVSAFPAEQRGRALGLMALCTYGGLTIGPSLGGFLADHIDWRAAFFINLPVGIAAVTLGLRMVPNKEQSRRDPIDVPGAVIFMAALSALILGLHRAPDDGWGSPLVISLLVASAVLLSIFAFIESHVTHPILDLNLFRVRSFTAGVGSALINYMGVGSVLFLFPYFFVRYQDYSISESALILTAMPAAMMVTAPFSGRLSDRIGSRLLSTAGMCTLSAGLVLLGLLGKNGGLDVIPALIMIGVANGSFAPPNNSAVMGALSPPQYGIGGSVLATARNFGLALGVALTSSLFRQRLDSGANDSFMYVNFTLAGIMLIGAFTSSLRGDTRAPRVATIQEQAS